MTDEIPMITPGEKQPEPTVATESEQPLIPPIEELFPPQPEKPKPQIITVRKVVKQKDTLRVEDARNWLKDTLIFCVIPTVLAVLQTLQASYMAHQGGWIMPADFTLAIGTGEGALIASMINLLSKYKSGI